MTKQKHKSVEDRVLEMEPRLDIEGHQFIPYCCFEKHKGVILDNTKCEDHDCTHYVRLYLEYQI